MFTFTLEQLQIWSVETVERLAHLELTPAGTLNPLAGSFFQGISTLSVLQAPDCVCVGSSTGSIHVFQCSNMLHFSEVRGDWLAPKYRGLLQMPYGNWL